MAAGGSALRLPPFRPTWQLVLSLGMHLVMGVSLFIGEWLTRPDAPLFDPNEVMTVSMVALPKANNRMPQKPMRTPDPPAGATEAPTPPPPPTASDMRVPDPTPTEGQPETVDRQREREELLAKARREALIRDMTAQIGPEDITATDPEGVDPADAILGPQGSATIDPELARWYRAASDAIYPQWTVLPSLLAAHPEYQVTLWVKVAADGRMSSPKVSKGTGNASFDNSALSALARTARIPPPPARFREQAAEGVYITLLARDLQ